MDQARQEGHALFGSSVCACARAPVRSGRCSQTTRSGTMPPTHAFALQSCHTPSWHSLCVFDTPPRLPWHARSA